MPNDMCLSGAPERGFTSCQSRFAYSVHIQRRSEPAPGGQLNSIGRRLESQPCMSPSVPAKPTVCDPVSELIRIRWQAFQGIQHRRINEILLFRDLEQSQEEGSGRARPSLSSSIKPLSETPGHSSRVSVSPTMERSIVPSGSLILNGDSSSDLSSDEEGTDESTLGSMGHIDSTELSRSLIRASSYSFAMNNFLQSLIAMRALGNEWNSLDSTRPRRLHVHLFQAFRKNATSQENLSSNESTHLVGQDTCPKVKTDKQAFDLLSCRQPSVEGINLMRRLKDIDRFFRGSNSIYAFKVTCALAVIGALFWAGQTRDFALQYGLSAAVLTAAVGVMPTLGQTWVSFVSQLIGQGVGLLYGTV